MRGNIAQLMQQAQKMQENLQKAQEEIARIEVTGSAGGGMVSVTLTGADTSTVILVLLAAVIVFLFQLFRDQIMGGLKSIPSPLPKTQKEPMAENKRAKIESWVLTGIVVLALFWPFFVSRGAVDLATLVLIYVMLALGLNVVVGLAG
ncbi:YbaB/EbfC family nucleoid-associated protein, partial [Marinobacter sp.]|uniref:YbaB/EbfC family nucleoid-associated protein n=1 Tax=Marinobacter sp. TaxID=50741 RepID=UPI0035C76A95